MNRKLALALATLLALSLTVPAHAQLLPERMLAGSPGPTGESDSAGEGAFSHSSRSSDPRPWWMPGPPREGSGQPDRRPASADSISDGLQECWDWIVRNVRAFCDDLNQETQRFVRRLVKDLLEPLGRILREAFQSL